MKVTEISSKEVNEILVETIQEVMKVNSCDIHDAIALVSKATNRSKEDLKKIMRDR